MLYHVLQYKGLKQGFWNNPVGRPFTWKALQNVRFCIILEFFRTLGCSKDHILVFCIVTRLYAFHDTLVPSLLVSFIMRTTLFWIGIWHNPTENRDNLVSILLLFVNGLAERNINDSWLIFFFQVFVIRFPTSSRHS